jgi:hypothetical protein
MPSTLKNTTVEITNNGTSRSFHHDGTVAGFLNTGGGWDMYANNSGQIWTPNYGWLHDYFFRVVGNCGATSTFTGQNVANCLENCTNFGDNAGIVITTQLVDEGATIRLRGVRHYVNCNCACTCK